MMDSNYSKKVDIQAVVEKSDVVSAGLLGLGAGIFLSGILGSKARKTLIWSFAGLGFASIFPKLYQFITKIYMGPETSRGAERTLKGIRRQI